MRQILDIWASGRGVVSLHCFQHVVAVEAYTREACLVEALGGCLACEGKGHRKGTCSTNSFTPALSGLLIYSMSNY